MQKNEIYALVYDNTRSVYVCLSFVYMVTGDTPDLVLQAPIHGISWHTKHKQSGGASRSHIIPLVKSCMSRI